MDTTTLAPPVQEPLLGADGQATQAWQSYFQAASNQAVDPATVTAAQATAAAAQTAAAAANAALAAIVAAGTIWNIGDFRQTMSALGPDWLLCDGSDALIASYPALFALIGANMGPGVGPGTFLLPTFGAMVGTVSPQLITFIRAL